MTKSKIKRISKRDLDRLAETNPELVKHFRHVKKEATEVYLNIGTTDFFLWDIYQDTRREIVHLLLTLGIRKEVKKE